MKINKLTKPIAVLLATSISITSCTKLNEKLNDSLTESQAQQFSSAQGLLKAAYDQMNQTLVSEFSYWSMTEHTTDELAGPTRAGDWDDNGRWRKLHAHTFDKTLDINSAVYGNLLIMQYNATNVLNFSPSAQQAAEARFLRAYSMYCTLSGWGQVAYRANDDKGLLPPVMQPGEAIAFIISELEAIISDLPTRNAAGAATANKDAARFLLMKAYLNKGAFVNRTAPTFEAGDMQKVIANANAMDGTYALNDNFFDIFGQNNASTSTESIFVLPNSSATTGRAGNSIRSRFFCTLHYNQTPGGWNGFTTLSDFYDKFEDADTRKGMSYAPITPTTGVRAGFLIGQQYDGSGAAISDQNGPLIFTREVNLRETTTPAITHSGIRVIKYTSTADNGNIPTNDVVFFRFADVLLMKAEAQLRSGDAAGGLTIVNQIRTKRGATTLPALTNEIMLDERGREMYWEGWRREDQTRFGTLLSANQLKAGTSDAKYILFPIPVNDVAANPNLKQNEGY